MKTTKMLTICFLALGLMVCQARISEAEEMGTAFTYQGRLMDKNKPADGPYSFQFRLYDSNDPCTGTLLESPIDINDLDVIDGHFVVELDFGSGIFDGNAVWLETRVVESPMGSDPATLSPLLELTPTPYAIYAKTAGGDNDWMVSGNDLYSIPSGNVGIGTNSPEKKLDIASVDYTDLGIGLRINTPGGTSWSIDNDVGVFKIVEHASCGPEFVNNTRIAVVGNCIGSPYGGNVGIGTTSPGEKLEVNGTVKATAFNLNGQTITSWPSGGDGIPAGGIIMWSGSIGNIPAGWALCDGSNGTPDLRDRFIVGAGNSYAVGATGGSTSHNHGGATGACGSVGGKPPESPWPKAPPNHTHSISSDEHLPPYYALVFIMKL